MSNDLLTQLAEYGRDSREQRLPVELADIFARGEAVRSLPLPEPVEPDVQKGRRWWAAVAAAAIVLLLVGGAAWLARTGDEVEPADQPTVATIPPEESTVTTEVPDDSVAETTAAARAGLVGPGSWTVLATFDGSDGADSLAGVSDEVRSWPGVLDVVVVDDGGAWRDVVGLQEDCTDATSVPCGAGLAVLTVVSQMQQTAMRFESDLGMNAVTATDVPRDLFAGYVDAAIENASPLSLEFDPAGLGTEVPLAGPSVPVLGPVCDDVDVRAVIRIVVDGFEIDACTAIYDEALVLEVAGGGGTGLEIGDLLVDGAGTRPVLFHRGPFGGREVYAVAGLPLDAAIVTAQLADGSMVWQRPLAGMALFVEGPEGTKLVTPFSLLDAQGNELARIELEEGSAIMTDLRIDPDTVASPAAEPPTPLEVTSYDVAFAAGLPLVEAGGGIWGVVGDDGLVRLDPGSGETSEAVQLEPGNVVDLTATEDAVWALTAQEGTFAALLSRIDAATGTVSDTYEFPGEAAWGRRFTVADGAVWASYHGGIGRIDLATGAVETISVGGAESAWWVGEVDGALWTHRPGRRVGRLDLDTREIETYIVGGDTDPLGVLAGDAIWVVDLDGFATRFDLDSLTASARVDMGAGNGWGVYADGGVWVPHPSQGTVTRIDASTGDVTDVIEVGEEVGWMAATTDAIWVQVVADADESALGTVARIDTAARQVTDVVDTGSGWWLSVVDGAVWVLGGDTTARIHPNAG